MKPVDRVIELLPKPILVGVAVIALGAWLVKEMRAHSTYGLTFRDAYFHAIVIFSVLAVAAYYGIKYILGRRLPEKFTEHERAERYQRRMMESGQQIRSLMILRLLRDVGIHMIMNRPPSDDQNRLRQNLDWWEGEVIKVGREAGASDGAISRFQTLGIVTSGSMIREKLQRLDEMIGEMEESMRTRAESLTERIRGLRQVVVSSVNVDHTRRIVEIVPLENPNVTLERVQRYREAECELLALGYRVTGWPGT